MLHPLLWVAGLLAGIALFAYGGAALRADDPMVMPLVASGSSLGLLSLVMLFVAWRKARQRGHAEALSSTDAVARWQLFDTDMAAFRAIDAARAGRLWSLANALKFPDEVPMAGLPVVVGKGTLLVGDHYYDLGFAQFGTLGELSFQPGEPGYLEAHCYLPGDTRKTHIVVLRLPVPGAARGEGEKAFHHLQASISPHDRAHIHRWFAAHFEAAGQADDSPHRLQQRRKWLIPVLILFCLTLLAVVLVPRLL